MENNWIKKGDYKTLDEYVSFYTGQDMASILKEDFGVDYQKKYPIPRLEKVAERLKKAAQCKEKVQIVADYDVDGITSAVILIYLCNHLHIPYLITIPKRFSEGYGLNEKIMERVPDDVRILLTVDNGIKAKAAIEQAKSRNMEVIILDHHQGEKDEDGNLILPDADIIVDPEALPEGCGFTHYCGAGLAFKLAEEVLGVGHPLTYYLSGFAAIGTIGDAVELLGENRRIVRQGMLSLFNNQTTSAVKQLLKAAKLNEGSSAQDIAYYLVPMLNAPGRLYDEGAKMSVLTLLRNANNEEEAMMVQNLVEINQKRKDIVAKIVASIPLEELKANDEHVIFYQNEDMPEGISGIIAGQISNATGKPAFAMTKKDGFWKGSARSNSENYSLIASMEEKADLFIAFGGHMKAAGFSVSPENVGALKEHLEMVIPLEKQEDTIPYDLEVPYALFPVMAKEILSLEPFGEGFPSPVIRVKGKLDYKFGSGFYLMGENKEHIKFQFKNFSAIAFYQAEKFKDKDKMFVDMIGTVNWNYFNGEKKLQLNLIDFKTF